MGAGCTVTQYQVATWALPSTEYIQSLTLMSMTAPRAKLQSASCEICPAKRYACCTFPSPSACQLSGPLSALPAVLCGAAVDDGTACPPTGSAQSTLGDDEEHLWSATGCRLCSNMLPCKPASDAAYLGAAVLAETHGHPAAAAAAAAVRGQCAPQLLLLLPLLPLPQLLPAPPPRQADPTQAAQLGYCQPEVVHVQNQDLQHG